jgi:serine/threonine-protein kinase
MSPEQARGERVIDARTDIYSVGVILYELVTGQMPFEGGSLAELLTHVVQGQYVALIERLPDAPAALVEIVQRAMHRDKNQRFANARDMRAAMAHANLAPFHHGESGVVVVEGARAKNQASSRSQTGVNPPSGLFRDPDAHSVRRSDEPRTPVPGPVAHVAPDLGDAEPTVANAAADTFDDEAATLVAGLLPTLPAAPVPAVNKPRPDATPLRHRDDSAGTFKVSAPEDKPKRSRPWAAILAVLALAGIACTILVYWLQAGGSFVPTDPIPAATDIPAGSSGEVLPTGSSGVDPTVPDESPSTLDPTAANPESPTVDDAPEERPTKNRRRRRRRRTR